MGVKRTASLLQRIASEEEYVFIVRMRNDDSSTSSSIQTMLMLYCYQSYDIIYLMKRKQPFVAFFLNKKVSKVYNE